MNVVSIALLLIKIVKIIVVTASALGLSVLIFAVVKRDNESYTSQFPGNVYGDPHAKFLRALNDKS